MTAFWMTGYLMGGAIAATGTLGAIATGAGASATGAALESMALGREAFVGSDGDIETTHKAQLWGALLGASEGIPIGMAYKRAGKFLEKANMKKTLLQEFKSVFARFNKESAKDAAYEGLEEATQEFLQGLGENYTAK